MVEPKVRFKRDDGFCYPAWITDSIGTLFEICAGGDIDKDNSADKYSEAFPYAVYANALVNKGLYGYANYYKVDYDCFTVTGRGDVGVAVARHEKFVPIVRLLVCKPRKRCNVDFFAEAINSTKILVEATGVPQLTSPQLGKIKVSFPSDIEEQQKIADFLSSVDEVITTSEEEIANLETQKKAVMKKIFSHEVRFKRDDGSDFPEWESDELGSLCDPHARIGWQNLRTDEFLSEGDYYLITGTDFNNGQVNFQTCHYIDKDRFDMDKNIQIHNGDILITKDGTLGKVAMVSGMDKPGTLNAGVFVLQNLSERLNNAYMYQYLAAPFLLKYASEKSTGGTIKHLNQGVLVQFSVPIPCLEEQHLIADFLSDFDEAIAAAKKELELWKKLKKGLLQQMFV